MKSNTQNTKIAAITEKTLIIGIDVGSETHFARAFNWRGYEFWVNHFFCVLDGYWLRTPPLTEPVRNAAA